MRIRGSQTRCWASRSGRCPSEQLYAQRGRHRLRRATYEEWEGSPTKCKRDLCRCRPRLEVQGLSMEVGVLRILFARRCGLVVSVDGCRRAGSGRVAAAAGNLHVPDRNRVAAAKTRTVRTGTAPASTHSAPTVPPRRRLHSAQKCGHESGHVSAPGGSSSASLHWTTSSKLCKKGKLCRFCSPTPPPKPCLT